MSTASFSPETSAEFTRNPAGDAVNTSVVSFVSARADEAATATREARASGSNLFMGESFRVGVLIRRIHRDRHHRMREVSSG